VSFDPEGKRSLRRITARGGVEVTNGDESARGELAEYDPAAGTIVLSENARLGSGPNSLAGARVVVFLNQKKAVVEGGASQVATPGQAAPAAPGGRIKAVFMPDSMKGDAPGKKP
jgi:lipopolysaccharide export system protein LptA